MVGSLRTLAGKRILVAGATGFLGRHLVRRLSSVGAEVFALSRNPDSDLEAGAARTLRADVADLTAVKSVFAQTRPNIVYQLCGHPDGGRDAKLVLPILQSDVVTSIHLLLTSLDFPVERFVTTASLEESDDGSAPTSPYAAAKMASTGYARMFHRLYQIPVVILRPFMTYGPGQPEKKVVSYIVKSLLTETAPRLGSGTRPVDWIYIDDVIDGLLAGGAAPGAEGLTFDLGSGHLVPLREVGQKLVRLIGARVVPEFGAVPDRPFERVRVADMKTPRERLGWAPKISLDDGLARTVEWWRERLAREQRKSQLQPI